MSQKFLWHVIWRCLSVAVALAEFEFGSLLQIHKQVCVHFAGGSYLRLQRLQDSSSRDICLLYSMWETFGHSRTYPFESYEASVFHAKTELFTAGNVVGAGDMGWLVQ